MRYLTKELRDSLTPQEALELLKKGNDRFVKNLKAQRNLLEEVNETSNCQYPFAVILSCMDSRTSAELIFNQGLGDVLSLRVAGNVLSQDMLGSLEFATSNIGSKIILVLGHTKCGAITAACNGFSMGSLTHLLNKIKPAIDFERETKSQRNGDNPEFVFNVTKLNVLHTIRRISNESNIIREQLNVRKIILVGGIYDVDTGKVDFFNS